MRTINVFKSILVSAGFWNNRADELGGCEEDPSKETAVDGNHSKNDDDHGDTVQTEIEETDKSRRITPKRSDVLLRYEVIQLSIPRELTFRKRYSARPMLTVHPVPNRHKKHLHSALYQLLPCCPSRSPHLELGPAHGRGYASLEWHRASRST